MRQGGEMPIRAWVVALLIASSTLACTESGSDAVDSATTTVAEWQPEIEGRIGSLDTPDQSLTEVGHVLIGPDEQLYISQPRDDDIRGYDARGSLTGMIGRSGEGPGEFANIDRIGLRGDTLYVADSGLGRVSFFALDGRFLSSTQWVTEPFRAGDAFFSPTAPHVLVGDGIALARPGFDMLMPPIRNDRMIFRVRVPFFRMDRPLQVVDTLVWQERSWTSAAVVRGGETFWSRCPFVDFPLAELMTDGSGVVIVDRRAAPSTDAAEFHVTLIGPAGDTTFSRSFPYRPVAMPAVAVQRAAERGRALHAQGSRTPPSTSEIERALRRADCIPMTLPPVSGLVTTQDGSIWLKREDAFGDSVLWNALDRAGRLRGKLRLPRAQNIAAATGDVLAAVELDTFDVPYVVRYRLRR